MFTNPVTLKMRELLDANARFDLEAKGTTNHCPMAIVALAELGAPPARLQEFFDMWERDYAVHARPVEIVIQRDAWAEQLGHAPAFGALRVCFLDWINEVGARNVILTVLKEIPFAPASVAFHTLIRLAYGIHAAHPGEIAAGLAALVSAHLPIAAPHNANGSAPSVDFAFAQITHATRQIPIEGNSITARLRAVAADARFGQTVLAPPASSNLLDDIARATIAAYWRTPDFTLLHTVTATHAARILFTELPAPLVERLLPDFWLALCAAYATVRKPASADVEVLDVALEWSELCQMAIASNDDHVIKMTYTCFCEDRRDPSPLYRASAARLITQDMARRQSRAQT